MRRELLDVEELVTTLPQMPNEVDQRDLRGVADAVEHRLGKECSVQRHSIDAAGQFAAAQAKAVKA